MNNTSNHNESILLECSREGIDCCFVIHKEFTNGVIQSESYHFHSLYEIHIPIKGKIHLLAEDANITITPGKLCIIPPNITHYIFPDETSYRTGFRFKFSDGDNILASAFGKLKNVTVIENCDIYNKYISVAIENSKAKLPGFMTSDLLFHALFETALRISPDSLKNNPPDSRHHDVITAEKTENFLNANFHKKITLNDLAQHLNLSKRQTERITDKLFGTTFSPLLNKKRLAAAKFLLSTTDMSVDEISQLCGFDDKNYFHRRFSSAFGTTPGKYRKNKYDT